MARHSKNNTTEYYRIKIKGRLDPKWSDWFAGMKITYKENTTLLTGPVTDQSALHGLLNRIRDLNLPLLLVEYIEGNEEEDSLEGREDEI